MAVNGFLVNNEVQKYNYESLENYNTPDFSSSSTYQVGDYVMYQGKLYRCTTEITTSGGWDSTKWSLAILSDDVANLKSSVESGEYGLSEPVKQAILQIARKVAYVDNQGQTYYDDLYDALYPLQVVSISAVYTQSGTVYDTDTLDSLKADLVVTATYSDSSTAVVPAADYTLSGTLIADTSTITVSYGSKTTTFSVTVSTTKLYTLYNYTFSGQDALDTELDLLPTDRSFTIAIDLDMSQSLRQGGALQNWGLVRYVNSAQNSGVAIKSLGSSDARQITCSWMTKWPTLAQNNNFSAFDYDFVGRARFVYVHTVGSGSATFYGKIGDNAIVNMALSQAYTSLDRGSVLIGGIPGGNQDFVGTITSLVIDSVAWDTTRINNFLT